MKTSRKRALLLVPIALFPLSGILAVAACEIAVNLDPALVDAGPRSDVLPCGICADVSSDADYDAADVSIYGIPPPSKDATLESAVRDSGADGRD
jgi:hypothetical protein